MIILGGIKIEWYWYWLCNIRGITRTKISKLLEYFITPDKIYSASKSQLAKCLELTSENVNDIINSRNYNKIQENINNMQKRGIKFFSVNNTFYPDKLKNISDFPYLLYYMGDQLDFSFPSVAIVGARNCTEYGRNLAKELGYQLGSSGITVISGLASGIDSSGQWGVIDAGGLTYGIMGCGVDICYPKENIELYERIQYSGGIISEYPPGRKPVGWQFPLRNRIISALADKIVVVEAREKSGSLITVEYGLEQGKDIYSVPGRVGDKLSEGCNRLIKEGAGIITSANDILEDFGLNNYHFCKNSRKNNIILEKELESLYSCVDLFPKSIQEIVDLSGKSFIDVLRGLVQLQMLDLIKEPSKNYYSRKI